MSTLPSRQGDVLVVPVAAMPAGVTPVERDKGRVILAYGEVTGHAHAIVDPAARLFEITDGEVEQRFLQIVGNTALLEHEEHATLTLEPGVYKVLRPREYEPESWRYVAD